MAMLAWFTATLRNSFALRERHTRSAASYHAELYSDWYELLQKGAALRSIDHPLTMLPADQRKLLSAAGGERRAEWLA